MDRKIGVVNVALSGIACLTLATGAFSADTPKSDQPVFKPESMKLLQRGYGQLTMQLYKPAIASLTEAVVKDDKNTSARRYLVYAYLHEGQTGKALEQLKFLTAQGKGTAEDYTLLGDAHLNIGWIDAAELDYKKALSLSPDWNTAQIGLIKVDVCNSNFDQALELCKKCMDQARQSRNQKSMTYFRDMIATINESKLNSMGNNGNVDLPRTSSNGSQTPPPADVMPKEF